jgi:hypothetical protein
LSSVVVGTKILFLFNYAAVRALKADLHSFNAKGRLQTGWLEEEEEEVGKSMRAASGAGNAAHTADRCYCMLAKHCMWVL